MHSCVRDGRVPLAPRRMLMQDVVLSRGRRSAGSAMHCDLARPGGVWLLKLVWVLSRSLPQCGDRDALGALLGLARRGRGHDIENRDLGLGRGVGV
eukprot:scaffold501_cov105-Isochrysis_galbana.AAC.1